MHSKLDVVIESAAKALGQDHRASLGLPYGQNFREVLYDWEMVLEKLDRNLPDA